MPRIVVVLIFLCGGCASAALLMASLAFRRGVDRVLLASAGMSSSLAAFAAVISQLLTTPDPVRMDVWVRWAGLSFFSAGAFAVLFWGHILYSRPPVRYAVVALACFALALFAISSPGGVRRSSITAVAARYTPWGDLVYEEVGPTSALGIVLVYVVSATVCLVPLLDASHLKHDLRTRLPVILSCGALLLSFVWDFVGDLGWRRGASVSVFGYLVVFTFLVPWLAARERRLIAIEEQQRQAQKLNALGQLAGGIAHDFNNLLTGILGASELLKRRFAAEPQAKELLNIVFDAGERAKELTQQLLSYSRRGRKSSEPIDLHELVRATVALVERTFAAKIRVSCSLEAPRPFVVGDRGQLQAAILNLCVNARDAMPGGGELRIVSDELSLGSRDAKARKLALAAGPYLRLRVTDTGPGMSAAVQRHLFEPFFTTKSTGTGLGLASTLGALMEHHGAITCESVEGRGTTFEILLPRATAPLPATSAEATTQPLQQQKRRVLIVDDSKMIRNVACAMLEGLGYEVETMSRAGDVLAHFRGGGSPYACVVLDAGMPDMSGRECFEALRTLAPSVPVVFCSSLPQDESLNVLVREGLAGFVSKPFSAAELAEAVEAATRRSTRP